MRYIDSIEQINPEMLEGFFQGWVCPPSNRTHLEVLRNSYAVVLAIDDSKEKVVGFITAISDGILSAHIPLFEVLPDYRNKAIGTELLRRMLARLKNLYGITLVCDNDLRPFYARFGMSAATAMNIRNYKWADANKP